MTGESINFRQFLLIVGLTDGTLIGLMFWGYARLMRRTRQAERRYNAIEERLEGGKRCLSCGGMR